MKRLLLLLSFISLVAPASAGIVIKFAEKKITQGSLQSVNLIVDEESFTKLDSFKLMGLTINESLYIQSVSSFTRNNGNDLEASATVVFIKVPKENAAIIETSKGNIQVDWGNTEILPTEASEGYLFGNFEIPRPKNILWGLSILIVLGVLVLTGIKLKKTRDQKSKAKKYLEKIKDQILSSSDYNSIVETWKKKHEIINHFPNLSSPFSNLEKELFKVQFKPVQSELEKEEVQKAYKLFLDQIKGDLDGI
jgi:hypothetical protein